MGAQGHTGHALWATRGGKCWRIPGARTAGARDRRIARSLEAESPEDVKKEELRQEHAARGKHPTDEELELEASILDAKPLVQRHPPRETGYTANPFGLAWQ